MSPPELIEPADAETLAVAHLAEELTTQVGFDLVEVVGSLPAVSSGFTPARETVVVRQTGGTEVDLVVTSAQLTYTSWALRPDDEVRASQIARRVHALVMAAERQGAMAGTPCYRVQPFTLPYPDPDPVTFRARYTATYVVDLRSTVL